MNKYILSLLSQLHRPGNPNSNPKTNKTNYIIISVHQKSWKQFNPIRKLILSRNLTKSLLFCSRYINGEREICFIKWPDGSSYPSSRADYW